MEQEKKAKISIQILQVTKKLQYPYIKTATALIRITKDTNTTTLVKALGTLTQ